MTDTIRDVLKNKIPTDTAAQVDVFRMIELNKPQFQGHESLLDLGAGTGSLTRDLGSRCQEYTMLVWT